MATVERKQSGSGLFCSEYFGLSDDDFVNAGVFNCLLNKDSNFYINISRLKESTEPEFVEAYRHFNDYFNNLAKLLSLSKTPSRENVCYRSAQDMFVFHEVGEINLGFSKTTRGIGWGKQLSRKVLKDAHEIVHVGIMQPELFHLLSLFESDVSCDRISDMIATIIKPDIITYTKRILRELGISPETRIDLPFSSEGLAVNPFKRKPILLLPANILHKLPVAREWFEIDDVISRNNAIRREVSVEILGKWEKWAARERKNYVKRYIFMNPIVCERVLNEYGYLHEDPLNLMSDVRYLAESMQREVRDSGLSFKRTESVSSLEGARHVIEVFKQWVEYHRGWETIQSVGTEKREKAVQACMHF